MMRRPPISTLPFKRGRTPFRKDPQRKQLALARRNMLRVFVNRGLFDLAERLRNLIKSPAVWDIKRQRFQALLTKYQEKVAPSA